MDNCVFCKIVKKEIPAELVYDDPGFLAFLSIDPQSPGHTLVIPKAHYRWVWDYPKLGEYFEVAKKIALAQRKIFGTEAIWSKVVGEEVEHAHVWLFPHPGEALGNKTDFKTNADKLRQCLQARQTAAPEELEHRATTGGDEGEAVEQV